MRKKSRNTIFFTRSLKQSVRLYLFLICILSYSAVQSQVNRKALDVAKTRFVDSLFQVAYLTALPKNSVADIQIPSIIFPDTPCTKKNVPTLFMERDCFIRFDLYNSGDTAKQFYFLPGFYLHSLRVFRTRPGNPGNIIEIPSSGTEQLRGGTLLSLASHDSATFYAKFQFVRANINNYLPAIIEKDYIREFKASLKNKDELLDRITYIASGILLLMIFYSMAVYLQGKKKEFLFYSIYTFCTGILLFLKSYFDQDSGMFHFIYEEYLDFMILCIGVFFYLFFLRTFLQTKQTYVFLDRFLKIADILLIGLLSIYSMIYLFSEKYVILNIMENYVIKWFLVIIGIVFIVYSSRKKHRLLNYLALGNLALLIFSIISLMIILFKFRFVEERNSVFNRAMFYYIIGLVLELICFLLGLAYKNRKDIIETAKESERLKVDNEKKELEKQVAVMAAQKEERDRISADMHDELGSGVTAIRLMSEIVKSKMKESSLPEIDRISISANDLLGKMDTIIWTMKSTNDNLENLVAYIRAYAIEYFENTSIQCDAHIGTIPAVQISGEKRRNIFLGIKEALHNIIKHANATTVDIRIEIKDGLLCIDIADNGTGLGQELQRRFGNGLYNMRQRMESIEGTFDIISNNGTTLLFRLPL